MMKQGGQTALDRREDEMIVPEFQPSTPEDWTTRTQTEEALIRGGQNLVWFFPSSMYSE
jgi:hypothetical protein